MSYRVELHRAARREVRELSANVRERVFDILGRLPEEPRPRGARKLSGRSEWRIRVGDYRIIYRVFDADEYILVTQITRRNERTYD